jgi:hypothetical protein
MVLAGVVSSAITGIYKFLLPSSKKLECERTEVPHHHCENQFFAQAEVRRRIVEN